MLDPVSKPIWWLPTLGFFLFLACELQLFWSPDLLFGDPGVGRHLRTADFILATQQVPRADPLSFTYAGKPWLDFEWAFEATLGELNRAGGLGLVAAFCAAIFAATILGIWRTLLQSGFSFSVTVLVTLVAFLTLHLHYSARPVLFTYLFMALVVEVWQRRRNPIRRDWVFLPIVFIAWANIHAGWAAGLAFLYLATTGRILDRMRHRVGGEDAPVIPWICMCALCTIVVSINPWGWSLLPRIFAFATTYKSFALWDEYAPPNFGDLSMTALTILFVLGIMVAARAVRRVSVWRWEMILPVFFFLYESLKSQRHALLLIEVAAVPLARDLDVLLHAKWWGNLRGQMREFQARQRLAGGDAWLCLLLALGFAAFFPGTSTARHIEVGKSTTPRLLDFVREHPDRFQRPLVTTWNAGPMLWNLRPDFRTSFDDRGDFYGDDTVFSFIDLGNGRAGWREKLDRDRYDSAVLDNYLPLNQLLHLTPDWHEVYRDAKTTVYWKTRATSPTP